MTLTAAALLSACPGDDSSTTSGGSGSTTGDATTMGPMTTVSPTSTGVATGEDTSGGATVGTTVSMDTTDGTTVDPTTGDPIVCGDGEIAGDEICDDGNTDDGDGCSATCEIDEGWDCEEEPSVCATTCGDMLVGAPVEECDDGNMEDTDDCTNACLLPVCGDGIVWAGNEGCDDGGTDPGDGCSDLCEIEAGYLCEGTPSTCAPAIFLADGAEGVVGSLYAMSLDGSMTTMLGPLGVPLTGMAFHPDGTLYAVTSTGAGGPGQLGTIDLATVSFSVIGPLVDAGGTARDRMPDITFMGSQLVGWTENGDDLTMIDTATGVVTVVPAPEFSFGTALAYNSTSDELLLAPDGSNGPLWTVTVGGMMMAGPTLGGLQSTVKGMSYYNGLLYGMDTGFAGPGGNIVTYDPATGAMVVLGSSPSDAVDALAVYDPDNMP